MNIKLITSIEIPFSKADDDPVCPQGYWENNPDEWYKYFNTALIRSSFVGYEPIVKGLHLYDVSQISLTDWENIIRLHISDLAIEDSCSLFGGYVLYVNGVPKLFPQCCGTLGDIFTWQELVSPEFKGDILVQMAILLLMYCVMVIW